MAQPQDLYHLYPLPAITTMTKRKKKKNDDNNNHHHHHHHHHHNSIDSDGSGKRGRRDGKALNNIQSRVELSSLGIIRRDDRQI